MAFLICHFTPLYGHYPPWGAQGVDTAYGSPCKGADARIVQTIRLKRQTCEQRFEIRAKSANIEKTDVRQSDGRRKPSAFFPLF